MGREAVSKQKTKKITYSFHDMIGVLNIEDLQNKNDERHILLYLTL